MLPATHGHASGTGPPARRSLLGSSRAQKEQQQHAQSRNFGFGEGGALLNGVVNGNGVARNALGNANGNGSSTVPQKRKLGMNAGAGGSGGNGSKARRDEDGGGVRERRREGDRGKVMSIDTVLNSGDGTGGGGEEGDEIRCRCGSNVDDGFSIACDVCGRWCHAACFAISKESVPEEWKCWICAPQNHLDTFPTNGHASTSKSRRRASVSGRRAGTVELSPLLPNGGTQLDDLEDERTQYVLIDDDIVPHAATQRKLRAYAAQWRGVSALEPTPPSHAHGHTPFVFGAPPPPHPTLLHPCASSSSSSSYAHTVLPPTYALHTALPAPPHTLLARYPSTITPSSAYLRAPTNGYAHAGAPKRFVHLVGPPLDVALDARGAGGKGRWVRSGCWPNAEVRAYICKGAVAGNASAVGGSGNGHAKGNGKGKGKMREDDHADDAEAKTHFGIFATRALQQGEEIVVGWEWDDANAVHRVAEVAGLDGLPIPPTPTQRHLIAQLANILHALGGAGVECACASSTMATATPAPPAHVPLAPKVTSGIERPPTMASADKEEVDGGDGEQEHERACVIRTMERVVFPPVPVERVQPRYHVHPGEEMDVDIDIEGDDAPLHPPLTPPRLGSPSPFAASSSSTTLHPSSSTSTFPIASSSSSIAHLSTSHPTKSSSSSSKTTPSVKPKRLAGPGVPPPSPEAPSARWGPLIGAARGVRAVERERGSGGWGGVVLDREVLDAAAGFAGYGHGYGTEGYFGDTYGARNGFGEKYARGGYTAAASTSGEVYAASTCKPYEIVERAGGWDVVPEGGVYGVKGSETEEDGEVGDGIRDDSTRKDHVRGKMRRREGKREVVPESVCPPKMRKRWKADLRAPTDGPPRVGKGKGKAPVQEEAMDVDVDGEVDVVAIDADERPPSPPRLPLAPPSLPSRFRPPLAPPPPGVPAGPSPSTSFAALSLVSPHPGAAGPRQAWFSVGAGANVEVLDHGDVPGVQWRRKEEEEQLEEPNADNVAVSAAAAVDARPSADAVASTSASAELETVPPVEVIVSPRVHFVEPVVHTESEPPDVESSTDVHSPEDDASHEDPLLLSIGEEEPYRPSPASPSPAPESEEEEELPIAPRAPGEEQAASVPAEHDPAAVPSVQVGSPATLLPPSPAWGNGSAVSLSPEAPPAITLAREPSLPPAPPPVAKVSFKEWQARRKLEKQAKEVEVAQEREREKLREQEREREREREERERDATLGEDKENTIVPVKPEDGLTRILDGIRRSAVSDKPPAVDLPVRQDVEMPDTVSLVAAPAAPPAPATIPALDEVQSKGISSPFSMTAFVATGNERLSPLAVSSVEESRTPSPRLTNGMKREASPLAVTSLPSPSVPNPNSPHPTVSSPSPVAQSALHSPKAPRYPSPSFTSNGVPRATPALSKPFHMSHSPAASFTTNRFFKPRSARSPSPLHRGPSPQRHPPSPPHQGPLPAPQPRPARRASPPHRGPSPASFQFPARATSQEEGEILGSSPPPPPMRRFGSQPTPRGSPFTPSAGPARTSPFASSAGPPTQPRSHQLQRLPPSAPKALREAQNPNTMGGPARGGPPRFNGMGPQTMPLHLSEPHQQQRPNRQRGRSWKQRPRG